MTRYSLFVPLLIACITCATASEHARITARVHARLTATPGDTVAVYIYFVDKGPDADKSLNDPLSLVSARSLERRKKVLPPTRLVDSTDVPVYRQYVDAIAPSIIRLRHELRWLNCVSVDVTGAQLNTIAALDCVAKIDLVEQYKAVRETPELGAVTAPLLKQSSPQMDSLNYGGSLRQDTLIKVNKVHNNGVFGQGVIIANFDAGFLQLTHRAFTTLPMKIWKKKDFHTGDTVTLASDSHGLATLSLAGGYAPGELISPAFASTYVLCRTEVDPTETPVEMDHWAAAAQWVDSLGVDIITSSLGYLEFDAPYAGYTYLDMNGHTLPVTIAAQLAVQKGITVCNSAGNSGGTAGHNTLGGPADAEGVITVGAVNSDGTKATYSSIGPTTDTPSRIKPDVMAQGTANVSATAGGIAPNGSGTSWACPMVAGVAACMLSANKSLTPTQIRGILRAFANTAAEPNNLVGWGTIDAARAVDSARALDVAPPVIVHTQPFTVTADTGAETLSAVITDNGIIRSTWAAEAPRLYYRKNSVGGWSAWSGVRAASVRADTFSFTIPSSRTGTTVEYYFAAQDIALPHPLVSTLPAGGAGMSPAGATAPGAVFHYAVGTTAVDATGGDIPSRYTLYANYPNPFNPVTEVRYDLPSAGAASITVFDINGRVVAELVNRVHAAGSYRVRFDASRLSSGTYVCQLHAGAFTARMKMMLLK